MSLRSNSLAHYGIKGMKWGIRRYQNKDGSLKPAGRKRYSSDYESSKSLRKKSYKELSNEELRSLNKRLNLESEYRRLNPKGIDKGQAVARKVLAVAGTAGAVYGLKDSPVVKAGANWIKKRMS